MTGKRFINDIDIGQLIDTKGELSTIDYSDKVDFYELWEFLNKLNDEKEELKQQSVVLNDKIEFLEIILKETDEDVFYATKKIIEQMTLENKKGDME